jgi:hypothetical protein
MMVAPKRVVTFRSSGKLPFDKALTDKAKKFCGVKLKKLTKRAFLSGDYCHPKK